MNHFLCQRCTNCCRWPGFVKVSNEEIASISAHLDMGERDFVEKHTRLRPARDGLALIEQPGGACIFLEGRDCRIQPVKPRQCKGFPNTWRFPGWRDVCGASAVEMPEEDRACMKP